MRAIYYEEKGAARDVLILGDQPKPQPQAGEVLVRLHASGVNPSDVKQRGAGSLISTSSAPHKRVIPHSDGAGIIEEVGTGVHSGRIGERVWIWNGQYGRAFGTAADYIALPARQAVILPEAASFEQGASLGIPALTAYACLFSTGSIKDKRVLVTGGAGAVGRYAIAMARLGGAREIFATISSEEKAQIARDAGADHAFNYRDGTVSDQILALTGDERIDHIVDVDFGTNLPESVKLIATGGTISSYASSATPQPILPFYPLMQRNVTLCFPLVYCLSDEIRTRAERDITQWLEEGELSHLIAARFPLAETAKAHELVETGKRSGTVIIQISD